MPMPGRQIIGGQPYRYAYQGQEKDPETGKEAFQLRLWDSRIGRWLTTDPARQYFSPYMGVDNRPISSINPTGGCTEEGCTHTAHGGHLPGFSLTFQTNNKTGYQPTLADFNVLEMLKQHNANLYYSINNKFKEGKYFRLSGGKDWGNFAEAWERGGEGDFYGNLNGIGINLEFAAPIPLNFQYYIWGEKPLYGLGFSFGMFNNHGYDDKGTFFTIKRAESPNITLGLSVDFISIENQRKNTTFYSQLKGFGYEAAANIFFIGYSRGANAPIYDDATFIPSIKTTTLSLGLDFGFSEWQTNTYVFPK